MKVIAKTNNGFILSATQGEVTAIASAMAGYSVSDKAAIGDDLSASDFSSLIERVRNFSSSYEYSNFVDRVEEFNKAVDDMKASVESAGKVI